MKISLKQNRSGIALIIVMLVIVVLSILAAGFAYTMKVETKLARNASVETDMEWLGRSGVELARYILAQEGLVPGGGQIDSLKQFWAGGPGDTNGLFAAMSFPWRLGVGEIDRPKIIDCDRKFNINKVNPLDPAPLRQALTLMGVDAGSFPTIVDSILDWSKPMGMGPRPAGARSETYQRMNPPYFCKDGPFDDMSELLLVNGITPEMYWGSAAMGHSAMLNKPKASRSRFEEPVYPIGLVDLFTTTSSGLININTASASVFEILGIPEPDANAIINGPGGRAGPDGVEGTDDDMPFRSVQELQRVGTIPPPLVQGLMPYCTVRSLMFEVQVTVRAGGATRTYVALLRRASPRDIQVMSMYWK
jgi:general secretion pathway protein K